MSRRRGRPIVGNAKAEKRRKYYADRYRRLKAEGQVGVHKSRRLARNPTPQQQVEERMVAIAEQMSHKPYHATSVNWEHISAGRSNS